jgi:hypothetical protein
VKIATLKRTPKAKFIFLALACALAFGTWNLPIMLWDFLNQTE